MKIAACFTLLATPAIALQGGYLSQMGGGGAVKTSSLKPMSAPAPAFGGTYLDQFSPAATNGVTAPTNGAVAPANGAVAPPPPAPPAGSTEFSMASLMAADAKPAAVGDYLTSLKTSAAPSGSGPVGYLDTVRTLAAEYAPSNLPGYLDTLAVSGATVMGGVGPASYLDNIQGASVVTAKVEAATDVTMMDNEPILAAINQLNANMNANQKATLELLQDINSSVRQLVTKAENGPSAPAVQQAPEGSTAPTSGDYLSRLVSSGSPTGAGPGSYLDVLASSGSPTGSGPGSYLDVLVSSGSPTGAGLGSYLDVL